MKFVAAGVLQKEKYLWMPWNKESPYEEAKLQSKATWNKTGFKHSNEIRQK